VGRAQVLSFQAPLILVLIGCCLCRRAGKRTEPAELPAHRGPLLRGCGALDSMQRFDCSSCCAVMRSWPRQGCACLDAACGCADKKSINSFHYWLIIFNYDAPCAFKPGQIPPIKQVLQVGRFWAFSHGVGPGVPSLVGSALLPRFTSNAIPLGCRASR